MERRPILLIDDDCDLLRLMRSAFENDGWRVMTAEDGRAGMKAFKADPPVLAVVDIIMPAQDGIETIMAMKARRAGVKILAISGGGRRGDVNFLKMASCLGADATLAKPFRMSTLVATARGLMAPA